MQCMILNVDFNGQHYRKVEKMECSPSTKMKSTSLMEAKAECYQNSECYMMYHKIGENKFYSCTVEHGRLKHYSNPGYPYKVTYIKGKQIFLFSFEVN